MFYKYRKYIIFIISILIIVLFCFIIFRSYKIYKIKSNVGNLPIIRSDVEIIKIKKDNRELKEIDVNSFYKTEEITESNFEKHNLDNTINNIVTTSAVEEITKNDQKPVIKEEEIQKDDFLDLVDNSNVVYDAAAQKYVQIPTETSNIKELVVNEKQEENTIKVDDVDDKFFKAQLVALRNQQQADNFINETKKKYSSILKNLNIFTVKIDLKEKGVFYRVQVGNFNTKEDAKKFCEEYVRLANKNLTNCIVVK